MLANVSNGYNSFNLNIGIQYHIKFVFSIHYIRWSTPIHIKPLD